MATQMPATMPTELMTAVTVLRQRNDICMPRMAAKALAPNIRVNGICPGPMLPPPGQSEEYLQSLAKTVPLGHVGDPSMIASAVAFLIDNEFITGQWLYVDGGQHL